MQAYFTFSNMNSFIVLVFQYLELRFSKAVRICGTVTFIFQMVSSALKETYDAVCACNTHNVFQKCF